MSRFAMKITPRRRSIAAVKEQVLLLEEKLAMEN
jgi:hypothetical protein